MTSTVISKETIHRLIKDVKQIIKNPLIDNGIYYCHDDEDLLKGYALIIGPEDTPYFGGYYFFEFHYPPDYPYSPPKVIFSTNNGTVRFNPNLYKCGKVCVSILNTWSGDKWTSCQTINSILLTLCSLLNKEPLLNEPGQKNDSRDFNSYHKVIEYYNIDFAICDLLHKEKIPPQFIGFYPFMKEHFVKKYEKLLQFVQDKRIENPDKVLYKVYLYSMDVSVNYSNLLNKLIETKTFVDTYTT